MPLKIGQETLGRLANSVQNAIFMASAGFDSKTGKEILRRLANAVQNTMQGFSLPGKSKQKS